MLLKVGVKIKNLPKHISFHETPSRLHPSSSTKYFVSTTRIKMVQTLSKAIDVTIGTEQGHPMSPELFKIYIRDLSVELESLADISSPELNGFRVTHLMWADDLILLALDRTSLQKQLDCLFKFTEDWELEVNISKTNIMVFNSSSKILQCSKGF